MASTASRPRVLVVDDDDAVRLALRLVLDEQHEVVEASDGGAALACLDGERVDVLVLDLLLPKVDGFQVLEHVRRLPRRIPVVVISGIATSWTAAAAMRLGVVDYITKPFDDAQLLTAVAEGLEARDPGYGRRPESARDPLVLFVGVPAGMRATLSVLLGSRCRVEGVADVAAAVARLRAVSPLAIVMRLSGETRRIHPDPLSRLRSAFPEGPVIVTAADDELRAAASPRAGALAWLREPVSVETLLHEIEASVPRPAARPARFGDVTRRILDDLAEHQARARLDTLGAASGMTPHGLAVHFRQEVGTPLGAYLRALRVELARLLLVETSDSVDTIATRVGLHDASHLSRIFLAHAGCRPGVYRRRALDAQRAIAGPAAAARTEPGRLWASIVDPPVSPDPFLPPTIRVAGDQRVAFDVAECTGELRPPPFVEAMVAGALREAGAPGSFPSAPPAAFVEAIDGYLAERGVDTGDGAVLTTSGASAGLGLLLGALGSTDDVVAVEHPTWPGALAVLASAGRRVLGIPVDDEGLRVDVLAAALRRHRVRLVYLQPSFQNPTGVSLSARRRLELLELARQFDVLVVEDDCAAELAYDEVPPRPLRTAEGADRVVYLKSFSTVLAPALRLAVMVAPRRYAGALQEAQHGDDVLASALARSLVARCLRTEEFRQHVERVRALLEARWQALSGALETRMPDGVRWTVPRGGLYTWLEIPPPLTTLDLLADVAGSGVGFVPGPVFCLGGSGQRGARLALGATPPLAIERGIRQLARAIRQRLHAAP